MGLICVFLLFVAVVFSASRCTKNETNIVCAYQKAVMPISKRMVFFQVPLTPAPARGFPAVIMFQGSFFGIDDTWTANKTGEYLFQTEKLLSTRSRAR